MTILSFLENFHFVITACCVTLIYLIQFLHYPSFKFIEEKDFKTFHHFHSQRITFIVAPLMLSELLIAVFMCTQNFSKLNISILLIILLIWLSTAFIQVPIHHKLQKGKDRILIDRLVKSNWIRTLLWTGEFILLILK